MKPTINTVEKVLEHHIGKKPKDVKELTGGLANFVYEAHVGDEKLIVRISDDPKRLQSFLKEQWAVAKAREKKVPTPEILEVGNEAAAFPYMIVKKVEGFSAEFHPQRMDVVREMGKYAAIINSIPTQGYGHVFDWSSNTLSKRETFADYLSRELKAWEQLKIFEEHSILRSGKIKLLKKYLRDMEAWKTRPVLNHGDMRLKNIILDEKGKIKTILDWENCKSSIAPYWEISIALHDLSIDEKEAFLDGYGIKEKDYEKLIPWIKVLNIINYGYIVGMATEAKDKAWLGRIRLRLNGAFDLYSI